MHLTENKNYITKEMLEDILPINKLVKNYKDFTSYNIRHKLIEEFKIYGLPTKESIEDLIKFINNRDVYDIGCGTGYLAYCLSKTSNLKITAIDNYKSGYVKEDIERWYNVIVTNAIEYVKNIENSVLIICWPNYNDSFMYDLCKNISSSNEIIYIGEGEGGCTADYDFFNAFEIKLLNVNWFRWYGIRDYVYKVKGKGK